MTDFKSIYDKFESVVDDETYATLTPDQKEKTLYLMLDQSATMRFKSCRQDLSLRDLEKNSFICTLTNEEEWILATYMKLIWHEKPLSFAETLEEKIGLRDFKSWDPSKRIRVLREVKDDVKRLTKEYIRSYDWENEELGLW